MRYPTFSNRLQEQAQSADTAVSQEEASHALQRILGSPEWAQSARMAEFLRFVVDQTQNGAGDQLKQTVIGVAVFGRDPDYDPRLDPVVRVEARRLRAKLQEYYSGSGAEDPVRIELPKGTYQPQFVRVRPLTLPSVAQNDATDAPVGLGVVSSRLAVVSVAAVALAIVSGVLALYWNSPKTGGPPRLLTDRQAYARSPRFSPDGSRVVFSREPGLSNSHIVVAPLSGGEPVALTSGAVRDYEPEWSPDGRRITFLRQIDALSYSLMLRDAASGGTEEMLLAGIRERSSLAFSRDGQRIFFADRPDETPPAAIFSVSLKSRERTRVTMPSDDIDGDTQPQISPDGATLVFLRKTATGVQDIYTQPLGGMEARRLSHERGSFQGICWTADGRSILAAFARGDQVGSVWRFPIHGGEPSRVAEAGIGPLTPAVSAVGNHLAFVVRIADTNIWRATLPQRGRAGEDPRPLTSSAALDTSPQISPDGSRIAWRSASTGTNEIWIASSVDGSNSQRLTSMRGPVTGSPRWSPDAKQIVFESHQSGHGRLFLISDTGGSARQLTQGTSNDILPSWSRDGRHIYYASNRSGQFQVWRMTSDGRDAQQITRNGGFAAFESMDGNTIYYSRQSGGIWKAPRDGGAETLVTSELAPNFWGQFAVAEHSLFYAVFSSQVRAIRRLELSTGKIYDVRPLTRLPVGWDSGMAVSRDESVIVWSQLDVGASDIYVVDEFR